MLKLMRDSFKHLKWILIAVVAAFVFGFVFLDMGLGGAMFGQEDRSNAFAARVNGETISHTDFYRLLQQYEDMYKQMYGGQFTPEMAAQMRLPNQVMDTLIDGRLITQEARRLNLDATPDELRKKLLEIPVFSQDGKFVGMELYTSYVTGRLGYASTAEFEAELARDIARSKMESALMSSVVVSPKAADAEYRRINENAKIRYVLVPAAQQAAMITVTPAEVKAHYTANQAKYTHGEQRSVRYLLADYAKLRSQIVPSDADLRKKYEASKQQYTSPDAAHVLHILIKVDPGAAPEVDAAARAKAESLVKQLRAGADFAALAQANSQDPGSAGNGGDMNWVSRGDTVEPFEKAIFSIPLNTISDPIRSQEFGYHIVRVLARRPAGVRSFEEVRGELAARTVNEMAQEQAQAELTRIGAILRGKKPKLEEFVVYANDKVASMDGGWVQKNDPIPGIGSHQPLQEWIFSAEMGDVSPVIGTPRGPAIAFLHNIRGSGVSPFEEIRAKVEENLKMSKAGEAARASLAQLMPGATSVDQIAQKTGLAPQEATASRQQSIAGLSGDIAPLVEAAIAANIGELKGPIVVKEGAIVFQVVEQKRVTPQDLAQNRTAFLNQLRQQQARNLRMTLIKRLRQESKIEVNDELLRPPQQQASL